MAYASDPEFADIEPLAQDEGGPHPLAAIAYTDEYADASAYLRAVMARNEMSERALRLTGDLIRMNPAHYTVWLYRAKVLLELSKPLDDEVAWLNEMARAHLKNYQIWHHRQTVVDRRGSCEGEMDSLREILSLDDKNYHVWSYRQWLVRRFGLWDEDEVEDMDVMLADDVRNNSAWNHRWFVIFGNEERKPMDDAVIVEREIEYAKSAIHRAPQNQSPWNYLRGLQRSARLPPTALKAFALEFASLDRPDDVTSSHALEVLADSYAAEGDTEKATKAFDLLIHRFDPVRARYWDWMKSSL